MKKKPINYFVMDALVSIITPIYNKEKYIESTIKSIQNQTYNNWELLLIDDASKDNSLEVVQSLLSNDNRIRLFKHKKNSGAAEARNLGTKMSKGKFIAFLDADDQWRPNKLELQIQCLNKTNVDICFSSYELIEANGKSLNKKVNALSTLSYKKLLKANYIGNLTGIYNCEKLGKIYTKDLKKRQDWLLWLEALKRSKYDALGIPETLAYYRILDGSLSSNKINLIKHNYNLYRKGLGFSFFKASFYLIQFLNEHFFVKRKLIRVIA